MIRVLIVDDDALVRAGLSMMLAGSDDIRVVAEASDGAQVPAAVDAYRPDVVLMDIRMPGVDGLAATEQLRRRDDAPQIIVLTTFDADDHVLRALRWWRTTRARRSVRLSRRPARAAARRR